MWRVTVCAGSVHGRRLSHGADGGRRSVGADAPTLLSADAGATELRRTPTYAHIEHALLQK